MALFMDKDLYYNSEQEKGRYEEHHNSVEDKGYQSFVTPITNGIFRDYKPTDIGLDFGAGTGPVISKLLEDAAYQIKQYDPFFHNYPELLEDQYDYIACCEVIEHFNDPYKEFELLKRLLKPGAKLYCMTSVYDSTIDFDKWYYKNDPTHVFIYRKETLEWVAQQLDFSKLTIEKNLVTFTK